MTGKGASPGRLRRGWNRISNLGADRLPDPRARKRVVLANQVAVTLAIPCVPYFFYFWQTGGRTVALFLPWVIAGYLFTPLLNASGRTRASRLWLITHGNLSIMGYAWALGPGSGMHLLWLSTCWVSPVLFDWSERKSMFYSLCLSSGFLLAFQARSAFGGEWEAILPQGKENLTRFMSTVTALAIQFASVLYFFQGNRRTEQALARAGEAAKAADKAKSQFLANMSHELRTPLNGILGMSRLLLRGELSPSQRETAAAVNSSAQDLLAIVNDILDLSSIEAGKLRLEQEPFSLPSLVEIVVTPFRIEAERKGLALETSLEPRIPARLIGDPVRLRQVLNNLLGNAFKFTDAGRVALRIRQAAIPQEGRTELEFEVEDSGIGIPEAARNALFKAFSQADASTTRRHEGTGLGLFITRQIVTAMGGRIGFTSTQGKGTVFRFSVEFLLAEGEQAEKATPAASPTRPRAGA